MFVSCLSKSKKNEIQTKEIKPEINQINFTKKDSIKIQNLIRKVYKWNEITKHNYFNIGIKHDTELKYTGIDWTTFENIKKELVKSGYFAKEFITNYQNVLIHIDQKLKNGVYEWNQGELPPFGTGANEWCHCQDTPTDKYWNSMIINTIHVNEKHINLTWDWGKNIEWNWINDYKTGYPLAVTNDYGSWKILYLDGFNKKYY